MLKHKFWIAKAKSDLKLARIGIKESDDVLDSAIYHTQQAAEKALKGYLVFMGQEPKKTHDLTVLIEICSCFDLNFKSLFMDAKILNPFSMAFRYPDNYWNIPSRNIAEGAIKSSEKILKFVIARILEVESGQKNIFKK